MLDKEERGWRNIETCITGVIKKANTHTHMHTHTFTHMHARDTTAFVQNSAGTREVKMKESDGT